jgi:hypothetical protein
MLEMMRSLGYELLGGIDTDAAYLYELRWYTCTCIQARRHDTTPSKYLIERLSHIAPVGVVWPHSRYLDPTFSLVRGSHALSSTVPKLRNAPSARMTRARAGGSLHVRTRSMGPPVLGAAGKRNANLHF